MKNAKKDFTIHCLEERRARLAAMKLEFSLMTEALEGCNRSVRLTLGRAERLVRQRKERFG